MDDVRTAWAYLNAPGRSVAGYIDQREALRHGWAEVVVARDDTLLLDYRDAGREQDEPAHTAEPKETVERSEYRDAGREQDEPAHTAEPKETVGRSEHTADSMATLASLAADTAEAARKALARIPRRDLLVVHLRAADDPDGVLAAAEETWAMRAYLPCHQVAYFGDTVPVPERPDLRLEQLDATWTDVVAFHYSLGLGAAYARQRLNAGVVLGAFLLDAGPGPTTSPAAPPQPAGTPAGTLVGFIGSHEEGSMGMLEVFPEYRRRGIGEYLTLAYASRLLARGRVPWSQVIAGNDASLAMQLKWGFTVAPERIAWLRPVSEERPTAS